MTNAQIRGHGDSWRTVKNANLRGAILREADLHGIDLSSFDLLQVDFTDANLTGANLTNADLTSANLTGANLREANLTRARLIRCRMSGAIVENSIVDDVHVQDLLSMPHAPTFLRLDDEGDLIIKGEDAATFFSQRAILEVFLTESLSPFELGCFHFHIGEMHSRAAHGGVFFIGHRNEDRGTVLRFQASTYDEIYAALPDLLAPFRMAPAVDWQRSLESVPAAKRNDVIVALEKKEAATAAGRWRFAERMAQVFEGFRRANVYRINEGSSRGIRIDVFTNKQVADRLSRIALPAPWDGQKSAYNNPGRRIKPVYWKY